MSTVDPLVTLAERPQELSRGQADVVLVRAERREGEDETFVYVVVEMKAPTNRDAWRVQDVQAIRRELRRRALEGGMDSSLVVNFVASPGTGDASAEPEDAAAPRRTR